MEKIKRKEMTQEKLDEALAEHELWLSSEGKDGTRLVLKNVDLEGVSLINKNLQKAYLANVNLTNSRMVYVNLTGSDLVQVDNYVIQGGSIMNITYGCGYI